MKPKDSFLGQPIRALQTMLRVLAENNDKYKMLIPDGIYGPDTMEAVRVFQRRPGDHRDRGGNRGRDYGEGRRS